MNKILGDEDRKELEPLIQDMFKKCPDMMARKYPEANVQQAFGLNEILKLSPSKTEPMLCVGSFEDTACEYLKSSGYSVIEIDPEINVTLNEFKKTTNQKFKIIFSISVLEHVKDDEEFITDICELLEIGGIAILTCDFREAEGAIHPLDFRFYKERDLFSRLGSIIQTHGCSLVGEPSWKREPNFTYDGFHYGFATWMFKKESGYNIFHGQIPWGTKHSEPDRVLRNFFPYDYKGVILDVGAGLPLQWSNSYHFRKNGWKVIAVEANPDHCKEFREAGFDVIECAAADYIGDSMPFDVHFQSGHALGGSHLGPTVGQYTDRTITTIKVKVLTLNKIIEDLFPDIEHVDILSLDVEGGEPAALRGFNFDKYKPKICAIEDHGSLETPAIMQQVGYELFMKNDYDTYYTRKQ